MKVKYEEGIKGRPGDGCPCGRRGDLGKIQGRSIDLGDYGIRECWVRRNLGSLGG